MKILLLGKNGLLGNELNRAFSPDESIDLIALGHDGLDITDENAVYEFLKEEKPNLVINAAAFTYVDDCETKENFVMDVNGHANEHLAKICHEIDAKLMYFSTDYVFDGEKDDGYFENDKTGPINVYGKSKLLGETLIQENTDQFYIIRTSWLFGMQGKNFVKTMLELANAKKTISVVNDQIGKPTYSHDLAENVFNFVKTGYDFGIYHMTNERVTSWYDFAANIFRIAKINVDLIPVTSKEFSRPAKRPRISTLINTKLPPMRDHLDALASYMKELKII